MRRLLLSVALGGSLLAHPAFAGEGCACGDEGCEQACTCSAGVCPLHRPGKAAPQASSTAAPTAAHAEKAAKQAPAPPASPTPKPTPSGGASPGRAPVTR